MRIRIVDAFSERPFGGNPAGVLLLDDAFPSDAWLQQVAAEVNLSETAFLVERDDASFDLRWFTPATEVDLCGHATLASAHVLGGSATFHTRSGVLRCRKAADDWIEMDFPALPPTPAASDDSLARALGTTEIYTVGASRFDLLVEVRGLVGRVRDLLHADHLPGVFLDQLLLSHCLLCIALSTSTITATSLSSARPRSAHRW